MTFKWLQVMGCWKKNLLVGVVVEKSWLQTWLQDFNWLQEWLFKWLWYMQSFCHHNTASEGGLKISWGMVKHHGVNPWCFNHHWHNIMGTHDVLPPWWNNTEAFPHATPDTNTYSSLREIIRSRPPPPSHKHKYFYGIQLIFQYSDINCWIVSFSDNWGFWCGNWPSIDV